MDYVAEATALDIDGLQLYWEKWKCYIFKSFGSKCGERLFALQTNCLKKKYTVVKIIRMGSMVGLQDIMKNDVKVLHLVRDPRSQWLSRIKVIAEEQKKNPQQAINHHLQQVNTKPDYVVHSCEELYQDLQILKNLQTTGLKNYKILRYEDVGFDPSVMAATMFNYSDIPLHKNVLNWLTANTQRQQG